MKKIFYSLMAVALCSCAQSEVEDVVTAPQPENKGVRFEVVDNGFTYEDGTRVHYGEYGSADNGAYKASFDNNDAIGVYAIKSSEMQDGKPQAYVFQNKKLTLTNGTWTGDLGDISGADFLFAYAPYRENVDLAKGAPLFTGTHNSWAVSKDNNRFFVWDYLNQNNGTLDDFKKADWMGAVVNLTPEQKSGDATISFQMEHMRSMIEVTTHKDVELTGLILRVGVSEITDGAGYEFTPYFFNETDKDRTVNVYRILTTEYRSKNAVWVTIKDDKLVKKYKKTFNDASVGAGKCVQVNINYSPAPTITISEANTLAKALTDIYESDYATDPALTTLRLAGTLSGEIDGDGNATGDWATLRSLTKLKSLDMYQLENKEIPQKFLSMYVGDKDPLRTALTSLVLPKDLNTIGGDAFQGLNVANIDIPATVKTIKAGAFYWCTKTSIRIPDNSELVTIEYGAFNNAGAVYTYAGNTSMLVLPASLKSIGTASAFGVSSLKKVIFKGETAPTIDSKSFDGTNATIYVPKRDGYQGKFPGKTVYAGPTLTFDKYSSDFTFDPSAGWEDGLGLAALCDGITGVGGNHWHSKYSNDCSNNEWGIYIDIDLSKEYNDLYVSFTTRSENANGAPTKVKIAVSNDGTNYNIVDSEHTIDYGGTNYGSIQNITKILGPITAGSNYKYVRFAITEAAGETIANTQEAGSANLAELMLYKETWTEAAATPAQ